MEEGVELSGSERWIQIRNAAGYQSTASLERALDVAHGQIWSWVTRGREPTLGLFRRLARLLGVSLDVLDETIVSWKREVAEQRGLKAAAGGGSE